MTSMNEMVINFRITETCNDRCKYCSAIRESNDLQAELHHASGDIQSLMLKSSDYFFSKNPTREVLGYQTVKINFTGRSPAMAGGR